MSDIKKGVIDSNRGAITMSDVIPNGREVTKKDVDDYVKLSAQEKELKFKLIKEQRTEGKKEK
jgi:hypothetical protein